MFNVADKVFYKFEVLDVFFHQKPVMDVITYAVGIFFEKKLFVIADALNRVDLKDTDNIIVDLERELVYK